MTHRVGVVGARRRREGLGPFVARELQRAGADISCYLSTSEATRDATRAELERLSGVRARGYLSLEEMLAGERPDALAILSPAETHERYLEAALAGELHVLCEKPFLWGRPRLAARTAEIAQGFAARALLLFENCQWPYTLEAYERLHPGVLAARPARFEMRMQPAAGGLQMLGDSAPHALSLLQAAIPGPGASIEGVRFTGDRESGPLELEFTYRSGSAALAARLTLRPTRAHPREAAFAFDGRWARRHVEPESYALSFADAGRSVPVPDPLSRLLADFVRCLRDRDDAFCAARRSEILERMALLETLVDAFASREG